MAMSCFMLAVIAKRVLHNLCVQLFIFQQRNVMPARRIVDIARSMFLQRVISARKNDTELAMFRAASSVESRYKGVRPPPVTDTGAAWHQCFTVEHIRATGHRSFHVPHVDADRVVMLDSNGHT